MSTFQEIIQFFNDTHVRNAIHENVCLIFYGTDLILFICIKFPPSSYAADDGNISLIKKAQNFGNLYEETSSLCHQVRI